MSYTIDVNALLHRKIKDGKEYEGLIPKFENTVHRFDKESDNSDTFDTLEFMSQWHKKYAWQMAKIAPLLKGRSLQETCRNIYDFLYWHFQYKLDGEAQNLHSPSAAWHNRKVGFDCKTYSLLAAMILSNLKIDCAFRMVQQSMPYWQHVYVIVPDGNSYHVIDATTHDNKEVRFSKKYDKNMHHLGLANPVTSLGCACQGKAITKQGLGNPDALSTAIRNFHIFLNELEKKGVSRAVTNNMLAIVKSNIENGIDPNLNEVFQRALVQSRAPFTFSLGVSITDVVNAASGDTTAIAGAIKNLIPTSFIGGTFGQIFANGFNLSCWGASYPPSEAKAEIEKDLPFFLSHTGIDKAVSNETVNNFSNFTSAAIALHKYLAADASASCSRDGHNLYVKGVETLRKNLFDLLAAQGFVLTPSAIVKNAHFEVASPGLPANFHGQKWVWGYPNDPARSYDYQSYTVSKITPEPVPTQGNTTGSNTSGNTTGSNTSGNADPLANAYTVLDNKNGTYTVTNKVTGISTTYTADEAYRLGYAPKPKGNGISGGAILAIGGAAAAFLLITPKTDVTKTAAKKTSTKKAK